MSEDTKPFPVACRPGIRRDGSSLETAEFRDGKWTRWHFSRARKIGGYRRIIQGGIDSLYAINLYPKNNIGWTHMAAIDGVLQVTLNGDTGLGSSVVDRTPGSYVSAADALWSFSTMYDDAAGSDYTRIMAHVAPNLEHIDSSTPGLLYSGRVDGSDTLTLVGTAPAVSGGMAIIQPYAFLFGSDGDINWSDANTPTVWAGGDAGSDRITDKKIVYGAPTRGATVPTGLFWSLDALIRATYVGGAGIWSFNIVADDISIMSSRCVAKYDGVFFWVGNGRFFFYDGVVRELPNNYNLDWFFDNINKNSRQKVFTITNQRFGEIWFCFPFGSATECTHAAIFNVRGKYWYDTELPADGRVSGFESSTFWWPIMGCTNGNLHLHEYGYDKITGSRVEPIEAYYKTSDISWLTTGPGKNAWVGEDRWNKLLLIEADWVNQSGNININVYHRAYANEDEVQTGDTIVVTENTDVSKIKLTGRITTLKFSSNDQGGFFQQGELLLHFGVDDGRGK